MKLSLVLRYCFSQPIRKQIIPEKITLEPFENYFLVNTHSYSFLLPEAPNCDEVYEHQPDTPSNLLKRNAIHIFPQSVGYITIQQKYNAHLRRMRQNYDKAFEKCSTPSQIFHLQRRVKTDMKNKCKLIGQVTGRYKHYHVFQSLDEIRAEKTAEEYKKNGVKIDLLNGKKIFPQGPTWMPTNQDYLKLFSDYLYSHPETKPNAILDLGCGSGILSFICAKVFKNARITAVDKNEHAVETCEINAASLGFFNIKAIKADYTKNNQMENALLSEKLALKYDLIVSNPPWIPCKRNKKESIILQGVYDGEGKCLEQSFRIAKQKLKDRNSRMVLIYSDLSRILGLEKKSVDDLASENSLIIHSKTDIPYSKILTKQSPLNAFKQRASIILYEIGI